MASPRAPRQSKDAAAAETRRALLAAGEKILLDQPVGSVLDQVKAPEVARRAQRTTGAFYHHWATQADYQHELIEYMLGPDRNTAAGDTLGGLTAHLATDITLPHLVHVVGLDALLQVRDNPRLPLLLSLWAKQAQSDQIRDLIQRNFRATSETIARGYAVVLDHYGLQMRSPFTIDMLTVVLTGLIQGLAIRAAVDPDAVPLHLAVTFPAEGTSDDTWDLYSSTVLAIIGAMTTPDTTSGPSRGTTTPDLLAAFDELIAASR